MNEETQVQPEQEAGKTEKKFNDTLAKVAQILGGDSLLKPKKKVKGSIVSDIVEELTKERVEANRTAVKAELGTLLTKYIDLEAELLKKEDELKKLKESKQKEFVEAANKFFNKIEDVDAFAKSMEDALKTATKGTTLKPATKGTTLKPAKKGTTQN
jgi:hypothetical protein